jgi:hypothetical protein
MYATNVSLLSMATSNNLGTGRLPSGSVTPLTSLGAARPDDHAQK